MMSFQVGSFIVCLQLAFVTQILGQGLYVSMVRTPDDVSCGHLQCLIDINKTDSRIKVLTELNIFDVTKDTSHVKVASLSAYATVVIVEPTKSNVIIATGSVTKYHADLTLRFFTETDCLHGSFQCELNFVNVSDELDIITEVVTPEKNGNCSTVMNKLLEMATQLKAQSDATDSKLAVMKSEIETLFQGQLTDLRTYMKTAFNNVLEQLSRPEKVLNSSFTTVPVNTVQITCERRMPISHPRQKFLLWGHIEALCDTETDGGGWIVIQRRTNGNVDFYRGWNDYKNGFGTPDTDFWIGNDIIHNLTSQGYVDLRIDLEYEGKKYFASYSNFKVAEEKLNYYADVGEYTGTAGDSWIYNRGAAFSTYDRDNDAYGANCAEHYHGAWWYRACTNINLNGLWAARNVSSVAWYYVSGYNSVSYSEMKIRQL